MDEDINNLERKIENLSIELLSSSININNEISKIKKDCYKNLMIALKIIQKQKEEIINLKIIILELNDEIDKKDIMKFCS